jgi:hypothetical protein
VARLTTGPPGGRQPTPEQLRPLHELWTNQNFQDNWVKNIRAELAEFKEAIWSLDFENMSPTNAKTWAEVLKLPVPKEQGDLEIALVGLRAVVSYTEWKLGQLERRAAQFFEMTKQ